jgi:hypothetical protein
VLDATVDGTLRLGYDVQDGVFRPEDAPENAAYLERVDVLFARGYEPGSYGAWEHKVRPLGLNFEVGVRRPISLLASHAGLRDSARRVVKRVTRRDPPLVLSTFERLPQRPRGGPVLFLTRLWDPAEDHGPPELTRRLNADRVQLVRALRAAFGERLVGGLQPTAYALEHHPEEVAPPELTYRRSFLERMHAADVCVTTEGLLRSTGWKFAEYLAASKPIVTEPLAFGVPGDLAAGRNYLTFGSPEECVARVRQYLDDPDLAYAHAVANFDHYRTWVRPDALVRHTLAEALATR